MRICLISREFPPDTGWGGIATFTRHLAYGLKDLGHDVEVVSLAREGDAAKTIMQDGIAVHRVEPFMVPGDMGAMSRCMPYSRYVLRCSTALWKRCAELHDERPFDVVDTPELLGEGVVPAVTKALPLVIRLYTPHSKFLAERLHNVTPIFDHQFVAMIERVAMTAADLITSPSNDLADFVANDLNYPRDQIAIVCNPIDAGEFTPQGPVALKKDGRPIVLFVGRLEERKGIGYLIDAVPLVKAKVPNVRFVVIGDDTRTAKGETSVLAELKERLRKSGSTDSVEWIDRVPLTELPAYYRSADLSVVPSVYDNSPYTCLEAMSCGRAVVATNSGGTPEYLGDTGVMVPPRDSQSLAAAMIGLLQDEPARERLGQAARRRVLEQFDRTEIAAQTVLLYERACRTFIAKHQSRLYLKPASEFLADAGTMLYAYDKMLYDMLYRFSWRFRIWHWWTIVRNRPRLLAAKAILKGAQAVCRMSGRNAANQPEFVRRLESQVEEKQKDLPYRTKGCMTAKQ